MNETGAGGTLRSDTSLAATRLAVGASPDINGLHLFAQVVAHSGFSAAALAIGVPKSRLSRHVARLEESLGVRLLQRTSRRFGLTEAGRLLYQHCEAMLAEAQAGETAVRDLGSIPGGRVRISVPVELCDTLLAPLFPRFMTLFPRVRLDVQVTNRQVDLLQDGIDMVVRGGGEIVADSSLVLVPLGQVPWRLVASAGLMRQDMPIDVPEDLVRWPMLAQTCGAMVVRSQALWAADGTAVQVPVTVRMQSDNLQVLLHAALAGQGICGLPEYCCAAALAAGHLVTVLPGWRPREGRLAALLPARRGVTAAQRALLDFLKAELPPMIASVPRA
jgi:DNA-binding transcriptional LysR family regulator